MLYVCILCVFFTQTNSIVACYNICVINYVKPLLWSSFWYWSHIFLAISSLLTFACSFSALLGNLHASPPVASSFWYNISPILSGGDISSELYIQMKLRIAARAGVWQAFTAMSYLGGCTRIQNHCFKTPKMCSMTLHSQAWWRLNNSSGVDGLDWSWWVHWD